MRQNESIHCHFLYPSQPARAGPPAARPFLLAAYSAGLRLSEACSLRWPDLQFERGMLRVDNGKGRKDRYLPLSPVLAGEILPRRAGAAAGGPVFPSSQGERSRPICHATGRRYYNLAVRAAGVARLGGSTACATATPPTSSSAGSTSTPSGS